MVGVYALKHRTLLLSLLFGSLCWLAAGASAAELKVGFVDAKRVLEQAPQAQAMVSRLQKEFEPRKEQVMNTQDKLQRVEDKLSRDGDVMSDSERSKVEHEALSLRRDLKRYQQDFQDDLNMRRSEELGKLQNLVNEAIKSIGGRGKYDLILYDGIAYANDRLDLTDQVLAWLADKAKQSSATKKK